MEFPPCFTTSNSTCEVLNRPTCNLNLESSYRFSSLNSMNLCQYNTLQRFITSSMFTFCQFETTNWLTKGKPMTRTKILSNLTAEQTGHCFDQWDIQGMTLGQSFRKSLGKQQSQLTPIFPCPVSFPFLQSRSTADRTVLEAILLLHRWLDGSRAGARIIPEAGNHHSGTEMPNSRHWVTWKELKSIFVWTFIFLVSLTAKWNV